MIAFSESSSLQVETAGNPPRASGVPRVKILRRDQVNGEALSKWRDLAKRSCHHNAFLLPEFVTNSWHYLDPGEEDVLLVVEDALQGKWLAAGGFHLQQVTRRLAVPHAVATQSRHS